MRMEDLNNQGTICQGQIAPPIRRPTPALTVLARRPYLQTVF